MMSSKPNQAYFYSLRGVCARTVTYFPSSASFELTNILHSSQSPLACRFASIGRRSQVSGSRGRINKGRNILLRKWTRATKTL